MEGAGGREGASPCPVPGGRTFENLQTIHEEDAESSRLHLLVMFHVGS